MFYPGEIFSKFCLGLLPIVAIGLIIAFRPKKRKDVWEYGSCRGKQARRHRIKGNVQFIICKAGEHGHEIDQWIDFDKSWWPVFEKFRAPDSLEQRLFNYFASEHGIILLESDIDAVKEIFKR